MTAYHLECSRVYASYILSDFALSCAVNMFIFMVLYLDDNGKGQVVPVLN
jgi:hypothetical protein